MPHHRSSAGFTIVELVVVMTVAGLLLLIATPRTGVQERRLAGGVREAWSVLTAARQQAVLLQHDVLVDFDTAAQTVTVLQDADNDGTRDAGEVVAIHAFEDVVFGRGAALAGPTGTAAASFEVPTGNAQPRLVFHRNGSASEFGGFYLRTERAGSEPWADEVRLITVERATGRVSAFRQSGSGWERRF